MARRDRTKLTNNAERLLNNFAILEHEGRINLHNGVTINTCRLIKKKQNKLFAFPSPINPALNHVMLMEIFDLVLASSASKVDKDAETDSLYASDSVSLTTTEASAKSVLPHNNLNTANFFSAVSLVFVNRQLCF